MPNQLINYRNRLRTSGYISGRRPVSPPYTVNLLGWYKADVGVLKTGGAAAGDGDAINTVNDQSGNGYNLTVANSIPTYTTNAGNGLPAMVFDNASLLSNASILGVGNWGGAVGTEIVCCMPINGNYFVALTGSDNTGNWRYSGGANGYFAEFRNARLTGYPTSVPYSKHIIFTIVSGAVNYFVRVNGAQGSNQAPSWGVNATMYLGGTSASTAMAGFIFEFMLFNAELSTAQIAQNEAYLASKWNVT